MSKLITNTIRHTGASVDALTFDNAGNTLIADSEELQLGTGADTSIFFDGTRTAINTGSDTNNELRLLTAAAIRLGKRTDGTAAHAENMLRALPDGAVELYHNGTKRLETTADGIEVEGHVWLGDGEHVKLGSATNGDLQIYHSGDQNFIKVNGDGRINLLASEVRCENAAGNETMAKFIADGGCEFRYNDSKTFETLEYGARVSRASGGACGFDIVGPEGEAAELYIFSDDGDDNGDKWMLTAEPEHDASFKMYDGSNWKHVWWTNGDQIYLYYQDGSRLVTDANGVTVNGTVANNYNGSSAYGLNPNDSQTSGTHIQFQRQGYNNGNITHDTNNCAYNTSGSDRTLKKNFEDWTDSYWTAFKNINPQKFHFLTDKDTDPKCKGYIAQDLVDSFPEAYPKEVVSQKYMFNPSGMVPYLMKTLKEALIEIDTLKSKVAALEAG